MTQKYCTEGCTGRTGSVLIRLRLRERLAVSPERERSPRRRHRRRNRHRPTGMGDEPPHRTSGPPGVRPRWRRCPAPGRREHEQTRDTGRPRGARAAAKTETRALMCAGPRTRAPEQPARTPASRPQARPRGAARACGPRSTGTRHPSSSSPLRSSPIVRYPPTPVPASTRQADRVANTEYGNRNRDPTRFPSAFALYGFPRDPLRHATQYNSHTTE